MCLEIPQIPFRYCYFQLVVLRGHTSWFQSCLFIEPCTWLLCERLFLGKHHTHTHTQDPLKEVPMTIQSTDYINGQLGESEFLLGLLIEYGWGVIFISRDDSKAIAWPKKKIHFPWCRGVRKTASLWLSSRGQRHQESLSVAQAPPLSSCLLLL